MDKDPDVGHRADENSAGANLTVNYEPTDMDPTTILKYLAGLLVIVFACMLIVWGVYRSLATRAPHSATPGSPL
ncbi:MAG TPA: hypothetical protein VKE24_05025, partial [Candidatus Acidoferrales bacterium]|nr:hypothetical protein [Candidatus Acidoferrales bacterium]